MTDPAQMRRPYLRGRLDDVDSDADASGATADRSWLDQFRLWFEDASADPGVIEANAMQLATAGLDGRPSVRTVLLKGFDERGLVFYTNYASAKGRDLEANPQAAAVFAWLAHERQVRVTGAVSRVDAAETSAYFRTRPRGSQLGAWASPQSAVVASRAELEQAFADVERRFGADAASDTPSGAAADVPVPPFWGGYRIEPEVVEFWQGRPDRLHDRIRFRAAPTGWIVERLAP